MSVSGGDVAKHTMLSERSTQLLEYLCHGKGPEILYCLCNISMVIAGGSWNHQPPPCNSVTNV